MRKRLSSSFNCGKAGSRHWLHVSTSLSSPQWITVSQTRRCLQLPRFSNHTIFLHLRIKFEEGKVRVEKCSHEMVLLIFRAKHIETLRNTAHNSHHCLRLRENTTNHSKKRQIDIQTPRKCHEHSKKNDKLMSQIRKKTKHRNMANTTI